MHANLRYCCAPKQNNLVPWVKEVECDTSILQVKVNRLYTKGLKHTHLKPVTPCFLGVIWEVREHPAGDRFSCIQLAI